MFQLQIDASSALKSVAMLFQREEYQIFLFTLAFPLAPTYKENIIFVPDSVLTATKIQNPSLKRRISVLLKRLPHYNVMKIQMCIDSVLYIYETTSK
ncbi:hypothetical protein CEXT_766971 [Caerostris extrusa]|uniref:Uncharacterized protein n=1 Tax=Caerostris extrusa TaxID=172846 RepID=A0AAV4S151_CAEEX|nr:hypothetical protein CEXT_766971 [Caerostris extrusa]